MAGWRWVASSVTLPSLAGRAHREQNHRPELHVAEQPAGRLPRRGTAAGSARGRRPGGRAEAGEAADGPGAHGVSSLPGGVTVRGLLSMRGQPGEVTLAAALPAWGTVNGQQGRWGKPGLTRALPASAACWCWMSWTSWRARGRTCSTPFSSGPGCPALGSSSWVSAQQHGTAGPGDPPSFGGRMGGFPFAPPSCPPAPSLGYSPHLPSLTSLCP